MDRNQRDGREGARQEGRQRGRVVSDKRNRDREKQVRRGQQTGSRKNELTDKGAV